MIVAVVAVATSVARLRRRRRPASYQPSLSSPSSSPPSSSPLALLVTLFLPSTPSLVVVAAGPPSPASSSSSSAASSASSSRWTFLWHRPHRDSGDGGDPGFAFPSPVLPSSSLLARRGGAVADEVRPRDDDDGDDRDGRRRPKSSAELRREVTSAMAEAIARAEESLMEMEGEMDESFLPDGGNDDDDDDDDDGDDDDGGVRGTVGGPMLLFGDRVDEIVDVVSSTFLAFVKENCDDMTESDEAWAKDQRLVALKQVLGGTGGVHRLFHLHLQGLRDHYGRLYEGALSRSPVMVGDEIVEWDRRRRVAAQDAHEGFERAASASIPRICRRPDGELCDDGELTGMFGCVEALRGLLEDMHDATSSRYLDEEGWEDIVAGGEGDADDDSQRRRTPETRMGLRQLLKKVKAKVQKRGPARWYERLAAKIFVIGVNYVQGWIVLQSLRREARKRDLAMPKFPLF